MCRVVLISWQAMQRHVELTMLSGSVADQQEIDGTAISFKH